MKNKWQDTKNYMIGHVRLKGQKTTYILSFQSMSAKELAVNLNSELSYSCFFYLKPVCDLVYLLYQYKAAVHNQGVLESFFQSNLMYKVIHIL